jgi:acyl-CoA reductase-like NAD-dependent aldehyde dehydrogenase
MLKNLIDGRLRPPGTEAIAVLNPSTGEKIPDSPAAVVEDAIAAAKRTHPPWSARPDRARRLPASCRRADPREARPDREHHRR